MVVDERRKREEGNRAGNEDDRDVPPGVNVPEQQVGVEDEKERQYGRAEVVGEALQAGLDRVGFSDGGSGVRGEPHGRSVVGKDTEEEAEEMGGNARHLEARRVGQGHDHLCREGSHHDVGGSGRQAHAENKRRKRGQHQYQDDVSAGEGVDYLGDALPGAHSDDPDDNAGRRARNAHCHHAFSAGYEALPDQVKRAACAGESFLAVAPRADELLHHDEPGKREDGVKGR